MPIKKPEIKSVTLIDDKGNKMRVKVKIGPRTITLLESENTIKEAECQRIAERIVGKIEDTLKTHITDVVTEILTGYEPWWLLRAEKDIDEGKPVTLKKTEGCVWLSIGKRDILIE